MIEEKPPLSAFRVLAHYGTKGMKWGVRKKRSTAQEIWDAEARQESRARNINRAVDRANLAKTPAAQKAAAKALQKAADEYNTSEDRVTAARMSRGQKAALVILTGGVGALTLPVLAVSNRATERSVDRERAALANRR
jgi:hypothetical protein